MSQLIDGFGRRHTNLRVSVTDRCNLRCSYCMPEQVTFLPREDILTFDQITRIVRVATTLGVDKIRLTGGEPLMRRGLCDLVRQIAAVEGVRDLGLTTNALLLADAAKSLSDAGLHRLNISLDTLDAGRFRRLTRRDGLEQVLAGIDAALAADFASIKLNAVIVRGLNDEDIVPLARFARRHGVQMRYIEFMPIGAEAWQRERMVPAYEILQAIEAEIGPLNPAPDYDPAAPAMDFDYADGGGRVGIIASVTRPFCRRCNRLRLTADGKVRNCLFALDEADMRPLLRSGTDQQIAELIRANIAEKWEGHEINLARYVKPARTMHAIGG